MKTSEQKKYNKINIMFPYVSSCSKLTGRKNIFCDKNFLCGNVHFSDVGNLSVT